LLQAETDEDIEKGAEIIEKVLKGESFDGSTDLKKDQMLQLQVIHGNLQKILVFMINFLTELNFSLGFIKDDFCTICHEKGHKSWQCQMK